MRAKNHMKKRFIHSALIVLLCTPQVLAAPVLQAKNIAATPLGQSYRARVEAIARDILWSNAQLLQSYERYETAQTAIDKPKRNTDTAALKTEADAAKITLLANMKTVQNNALRLRAISPVPRAWKRLDDDLVESAWEWSTSLDIMDLWLQHPSSALQLESARHSRRAQTLLDATRRDLWVLTDRAVAGKKYGD